MYQDPDVDRFIAALAAGIFSQRIKFGLSVETLAQKAKIAPRTVMSMEQKLVEPSLNSLVAVVMALGGDPKHVIPQLEGLFYDGSIPLPVVVGVNVRHHRVVSRMTRAALIRHSAVNLKTVYNIEDLQAQNLRLLTLLRLSAAIGVPLGELISLRNWEEKRRLHETLK